MVEARGPQGAERGWKTEARDQQAAERGYRGWNLEVGLAASRETGERGQEAGAMGWGEVERGQREGAGEVMAGRGEEGEGKASGVLPGKAQGRVPTQQEG